MQGYFYVIYWMSEWVAVAELQLSNVSAISWREQVNFQWDDDEVPFVLVQHPELYLFIVLTHWNNSPRIDMWPISGTLSWFRPNKYLLFLLNAVCLAKNTNANLIFFGSTQLGLKPKIYRTKPHKNP
jgi:hypothetical protein